MILEQYYLECLSHASYLIGDQRTGRAIVFDPRRDIAEYLDDAEKYGLVIEGVVNTHFHADFVSGHLELVDATGAWIGFGEAAETDYPIRRLRDGERLSLGDVELEILSTPGHTWESISVLVREHPGATPTAVLTGDSLFIGDVGRPDLVNLGDGSTTDLARAMYSTIHDKLLTLPDDVVVMPAHGAGSSCGKNLSTELTSTIGEQRASNPSVQPMTENAFVALVTDGQPAAPSYFSADAAMNKQVHPLLSPGRIIPALTPEAVRAELVSGTRVLDARSVDDFAAGHLRGSINVGFDGRFAETGGMVAEVGGRIVLIAYPGEEQEAALRLARIGSDNVTGYLGIGSDGAFPAELATLVETAPRTTVEQLDVMLAADEVTLIDIRNPGERDFGTIPGAIPIPLAQLRTRLDQVPTGKPIVMHCAGGWRSSVAASLLRAQGFENVSDLLGGYNAWADAHVPA
ncbi:MBL fold metallo-hydrolase [Rhodococcus sp. 05-2255-3B1]|uniref:rhodanese-like domain-containing protein n=1 Tax=unclassified Rhodococcus (in: high G+C Gram-positive bacteria) TaxID=192944 RepID=UPI000B9B7565|nr:MULTISPECIES: rhodanese-like domain-containing protein [unclassified Rhodococcus (in: high G+C Gram-positive bacteria)]OZE06844.1 MBL fold metallo-hydrolase [Rhodococcus sp. 05-2255-3B1]OZE12672.1 MBL fold metallo-hydrolase [Rhodococcus sp. 05-2255-2A2]OZE16849.1 MBL fold metallo-hydrolase [Rhodococcus sp. 05-2255-3C]